MTRDEVLAILDRKIETLNDLPAKTGDIVAVSLHDHRAVRDLVASIA